MIGWVIFGLLAFWVLTRVWFYVNIWAWRRSLKEPKEKLEADILIRSWRRSRRR